MFEERERKRREERASADALAAERAKRIRKADMRDGIKNILLILGGKILVGILAGLAG